MTRLPARADVGVGGLLGGLDSWDRWPIVPGSWGSGASVCRGWSLTVTIRRSLCGSRWNGAGGAGIRVAAAADGRRACGTPRDGPGVSSSRARISAGMMTWPFSV